MLLNTLGQLLTAGSQVGSLVKGNVSAVTSQLSAHPGFITAVNPTQGGSQTPQAYLTLLFFDERFEPVAESDGGVVRQQVAGVVGSAGATLGLGGIRAPRNGYVLVYVSNSSEQYVYFDNLQVGKVNSNLLEENHYYSFGLRIQALSSRRFTDGFQGQTRNDLLYQGSYAELDEDIGWTDFALRSYDAQMGRFINIDPYDQFASGYIGMGNDPVNLIDPSGGISIDFGAVGQFTGSVVADRALATLGGAALGYGIDRLLGGNGWTGAAIGGGLGLGATFVPPFNIGAIGNALKDATPSIAVQGANLAVSVDFNEKIDPYVQNAVYFPNSNSCKKKYEGYDATKDVEKYNCAGLAFRNYRWMNLPEVESLIEKNRITFGKEGDIKVWLWTYNIHLELEDGTVVSRPSSDFHIVGGMLGSGGKDPMNVYTKNGARPVFGPGKPTSWKPEAKDQARSNDRLNTAQFFNGQKVMKVRTNMVQRSYVLPCMNF